MSCGGGAAGDFDNDMDVDPYLVSARSRQSREPALREPGQRHLVRVPDAGGAAGRLAQVGSSASATWPPSPTTTSTASSISSWPTDCCISGRAGGPDKLYHNLGNGNHWLEIDLAGTASNHDGVGAKVYVTAGGKTAQGANGGYHRWSQDHQRLHFGLAGNLTAECESSGRRAPWISTESSPTRCTMRPRAVPWRLPLGPPVHTHLMAGDECGEPPYN
jgi:hypothetical protein